jgi:ABC-type branched-subunit amino acid transport system permease subunit
VQQFYDHANLIAIYAIYAVSLNVLLGYAGQLSVAHAAFGAVGGYMAAYLGVNHAWSFLPGLLVGGAAAGVVGVLASLPAMYLDVRFVILLTLALSTAIIAVVGAIPALGGATGLTSLPFPSVFGHTLATPSQFFTFALILGLIVLAVCWRMVNSPFGRVLRGVREDELATRGVGKNIVYYKVTVFGATAAMAGLAGVLMAPTFASDPQLGARFLIKAFAVIIVGGMGSYPGAIAAALLLGVIEVVGSYFAGAVIGSAFLFLLMLAVLLVRPRGLLGAGVRV